MCGTWSGDCCMGAVARVFRSSCRRGFRLQAEAFHRDAAWSAHGVGRSSPPHPSAWAEWPGARFGCSLVHDLARSAPRAEIAEVIDAWSAGVTGRLSTIARVARKAEIAEVSTKRISPNRDQTNDARTSRARATSRLLLA